MKYSIYILKRQLEHCILLPFIVLGRLLCMLRRTKRTGEYEYYLFFPFYHTGGAEQVHANIASVLNGKGIIYFTRRSQNERFLKAFQSSGATIRDISAYTDHKAWYFINLIMRGYLSAKINRDAKVRFVFNGQSNFGYKISPWIRQDIPQFELIHSFNSFSYIRIPYISYYRRTIMIAMVKIEEHLQQYRSIGVPDIYAQRIEYIANGIRLPEKKWYRSLHEAPLKVLYVGRGTPEKRVELVVRIAQQLEGRVLFGLAGDVAAALPDSLPSNITCYGNIEDEHRLADLYKTYDILIITSDTEGMPMVAEEAMSYGNVIISTPVGDIPRHILPGINGYLCSSIGHEEIIIKEMVEFIHTLDQHRDEMIRMANRNIDEAFEKFGIEKFKNAYQQLFSHTSAD